MTKRRHGLRVVAIANGLLILGLGGSGTAKGQDPIDRSRVKEPGAVTGKWEKTIYTRPGKQLLEERQEQKGVGYKPLTEMSAADKHFGEEGGLYGGGRNEPPAAHRQAAREALKRITPLDQQGKASKDGKVVF